jgi:hypothetical protein
MKTRFYFRNLVLLCCIFIASACSKEDSAPLCEENNTGTIIVENTRANGALQIFFDRTDAIPVNEAGELNIAPGEKASIQKPSGPRNLKANLLISDCNGGRCLVSSSRLEEKNVSLAACDEINIIY